MNIKIFYKKYWNIRIKHNNTIKNMKTCTKCKKEYNDDKFMNEKGDTYKRCEFCRQKERNRTNNTTSSKQGYTICMKCRKEFQDKEFINSKGKICRRCKKCREKEQIRSQEFYKKNKEKLQPRNRILAKNYYYTDKAKILRDKNKEQIKKYKQNYHQQNKETISEKQKIRYNDNKEMIQAKNKTYRDNNKKKIRSRRKILYQKNRDYILRRTKKYYQNNWIYSIFNTCRSRNNGYDCDFNAKYLKHLYKNNQYCHYCHIKLKLLTINNNYIPQKISCDRIDSKKGHTKDNIVLSCLFCNFAKNTSSYNDYKNFIQTLKYNIICKHDQKLYDNSYASKICKAIRGYWKRENIIDTIIPSEIRDLFKKQNGKSALTNIEMFPCKLPYYPFQPSVDRIDNNKPHTKDNLQLVCLAENFGRNKMTVDEFHNHINLIKNFDYYNDQIYTEFQNILDNLLLKYHEQIILKNI